MRDMNGYAIFNTTGSGQGFPGLYARSGQTVAICRELEDGREIDRTEVGPMYLVEFEDGYREEAFADELTPVTQGWVEGGQL